jgi:hypothetical protein
MAVESCKNEDDPSMSIKKSILLHQIAKNIEITCTNMKINGKYIA